MGAEGVGAQKGTGQNKKGPNGGGTSETAQKNNFSQEMSKETVEQNSILNLDY